MSQFRVAFLGTPDFAAFPLEKILQDSHFIVPLVISQPDKPKGRSMQLSPSPVKEVAQRFGVPVSTPENVNDVQVLRELADLKLDGIIVVAYGQILSQGLLDICPQRIVNIHGSLLPRWRGAAPIQRALMAGDPETGVALQVIVPKLDAGPVLGVRRLSLAPSMKAPEVYEKLKALSCELLQIDFVDYLRGNLFPQAQDESKVTIAKKIKKEEGLINWKNSADFIQNQIRGLSGWPGTWTFRSGKMVKILDGLAQGGGSSGQKPGSLISCKNGELIVACGAGSLSIFELQMESRGRQDVASFINGYGVKADEVWGT